MTQDFATGASWTLPKSDAFHESLIEEIQRNASSYQRLDPTKCITEYGVDFLSDRRHVMVVVSGSNSTDSLLGTLDWSYEYPQNSWVCGAYLLSDNKTLETQSIQDFDCSIHVALSGENYPWFVANQTVDHCLSEPVQDVCRLQFAVPIMGAVLTCNLVKMVCMIATLIASRSDTLVTLGDALSSFLTDPDVTTKGMCITTKKGIERGTWPARMSPKEWLNERHFRFEAVGARRWALLNAL